ncbi:hypothetical protein OKW20_002464 [Ensifer sp. LBL]
MSEPTVAEATNRIYESLNAADIDLHIASLKAALARASLKEAVFDRAKLVQNNRSGRKLMRAYFRLSKSLRMTPADANVTADFITRAAPRPRKASRLPIGRRVPRIRAPFTCQPVQPFVRNA